MVVGALLKDYSDLRLIRVIQGCGLATLLLNLIALWKQEKVRPMSDAERAAPRPRFAEAWADLMSGGTAGRLLAVVAVGAFGFNMQDVLLEPYGGQILGLSVAATTLLTAAYACGALVGFGLAARWLARGMDPYRMASRGILIGIAAFAAVIFAGPLHSTVVFFTGAFCIGTGGGLFSVATLTAAMAMPTAGVAGRGLALGAWGAAQATAAGLSIAFGGGLRDGVAALANGGHLGAAFNTPAIGYTFVYHTEIGLLFITLILLGPLVRTTLLTDQCKNPVKLGIADFPT